MGVMVPLSLYPDDLILICECAAGLQKQLNASETTAAYCQPQQNNLVVSEARRSSMSEFVLNGAVVERVDSYKYLGFVFQVTKELTFGTICNSCQESYVCYVAKVCLLGTGIRLCSASNLTTWYYLF